jgi:hypothetical protein
MDKLIDFLGLILPFVMIIFEFLKLNAKIEKLEKRLNEEHTHVWTFSSKDGVYDNLNLKRQKRK